MNREDNKRVMWLRLHRRYVQHCRAQSGRSVFISCDSLQLETVIGHRQTWEHQYTRPSGSDHRHTYPRSGHRCRRRGPSERSLLVASVVGPTWFGLGPIRSGLFQPDCRKKKRMKKEIAWQILMSRILRSVEGDQGEKEGVRRVGGLGLRVRASLQSSDSLFLAV